MPYTSPRTWLVGEVPTAAIFNTHLRDNLIALKDPPTAIYNVNEAADYSTSSTSFVDVDGTDLALSITTTGGDILVGFVGNVVNNANCAAFDVTLDGVRQAGDEGIIQAGHIRSDHALPVSFAYLIRSVSAGAHTVKLQWRVDASAVTMYAGAGSAGVAYGALADTHPQFWIREVS